VFDRLRSNALYLKWKKCDLYSKHINCLGHIIDDNGIHPDADKMARIWEWCTPHDYMDIQRFVGLVNYVGNFLPDITSYTGPLMAMTQNSAPFHWRPIHQRCFDMIKRICYKTPIIRPIDPRTEEPIWLICDASKTGVGAMYGQGPTWQRCRPAGFMSKKFTTAQHNYAVHELETLAILKALHKWEDKLVGYKLHIITDHKALEFFKMQSDLSHRQWRWMDHMSRFDFNITYVKGELNKVADCLSRYYENDTEFDVYEPHEYVREDARIDPTGEDLPTTRFQEVVEQVIEIRAMREGELRRSRRLQEQREERDIEAQIMAEASPNSSGAPNENSHVTVTEDRPPIPGDEDITLDDALFNRSNKSMPTVLQDDGFVRSI
jgi:RNase H-like domain found in reverse transcriptase